MTERLTSNRGRRFRAWLPLFSGYVFFAGDRQARQRALATRHVAGVLDVVDRDRFLAELSQIEKALDAGARLDPYPSISHGSLCRVRCGPFAGLEGMVVRKNVTRLLLQVEMLGQAASLEIDGSLLEPAA
jgi:transcriptional antiterminator RfaH